MGRIDEKTKCARCEAEMEEYIPGIGLECRCTNCGYKDPCCD